MAQTQHKEAQANYRMMLKVLNLYYASEFTPGLRQLTLLMNHRAKFTKTNKMHIRTKFCHVRKMILKDSFLRVHYLPLLRQVY